MVLLQNADINLSFFDPWVYFFAEFAVVFKILFDLFFDLPIGEVDMEVSL